LIEQQGKMGNAMCIGLDCDDGQFGDRHPESPPPVVSREHNGNHGSRRTKKKRGTRPSRPLSSPDMSNKKANTSLWRVGSKVFRKGSTDPVRASTYTHVHDAVIYNFQNVDNDKDGRPLGVVGLRNLGNTCFLNSSLQCLSNTIPLTDYFLGYDYVKEINKENFLGTKGELVTSYGSLMKQVWLGTRDVVEPASFKSKLARFAPQFHGCHQHDAQELISFLLDGIHEDLNRVRNRPYIEDRDCDGTNDEADAMEAWKNYLRRNKSLVVDLFQGQLRNTCVCLTCGHCNIRFEPFMYLSLPVTDSCISLNDCLDLYLQKDKLTGENQWYCEKCKEHRDATKKIDLWILPPILIFHLKRFKYDEYGKMGSKTSAVIEYPLEDWDLSSSICSKVGDKGSNYDLYAVSNHIGGLGSGHYTAHALNRFDENWYEFNDSSVRQVDPETHLRRNSSAYLLFYNRSDDDMVLAASQKNTTRRTSPLIRRQSVNRPDLWPHAQVSNAEFRSYTRSSRFSMAKKTSTSQSIDEEVFDDGHNDDSKGTTPESDSSS